MEVKGLDFAQFHALDHWPWGAYCRSQYGGWRRHLVLAWEFKWHARLLCSWGRHRWARGGDSTGWSGELCVFCWQRRK